MAINDVSQNGIRKTGVGETYIAQDQATAALRPIGLPPVQIFLDTFDTATLDVTNRWISTAGGTGIAAATVIGQTVLNSGTTLNSFSKLVSIPSFLPTQPGFLWCFKAINIEFPVLTTGYRFWGLATTAASPTIAAPLIEAMGFEVFTDGKLYAVTYQTGTRVVIADLSQTTGNKTQPQDSSVHKYFTYFRGDIAYWCIDTQDNVVAQYQTGISGPNVNTLQITQLAISNAGTALTMGINGVTVGDTSHTTSVIADGTFGWRKMAVGANGALAMQNIGAAAATYSSSFNVTAAASATDIATLSGSATKTIYITKVIISGVQTTASLNDILLVKRSTADTGGTSTAQTAVPHDSADAAASGIVLAYTANPAALGTLVGSFRRGYVPVSSAATVVPAIVVFDFGDKGKPIVLRGIAQQIAINLNGVTLVGGAFDIDIEWYES